MATLSELPIAPSNHRIPGSSLRSDAGPSLESHSRTECGKTFRDPARQRGFGQWAGRLGSPGVERRFSRARPRGPPLAQKNKPPTTMGVGDGGYGSGAEVSPRPFTVNNGALGGGERRVILVRWSGALGISRPESARGSSRCDRWAGFLNPVLRCHFTERMVMEHVSLDCIVCGTGRQSWATRKTNIAAWRANVCE
jgi:hypothetical protein